MKTAKGQIAIAYSSIVQELSGIISLKEELYKADYHAYLERKYGNIVKTPETLLEGNDYI